MVVEYQEDKLAEDSNDEKRIEKAERSAERKLLKKRKGTGKGKAPVMAKKPQSSWLQQRSTACQWQFGQYAPPMIWRPLGKQPAGMTRPIGPCFACGELGHLRHQCRKAGPSLATASSHRSYPCSSVLNKKGVKECSYVQFGGSNIQVAECRSIMGERSSEATREYWRCGACQGLSADTGSVSVASKSKVSCDHLVCEDDYCSGSEVDGDHVEGNDRCDYVRYWESDCQLSPESVKGRLRKSVQF